MLGLGAAWGCGGEDPPPVEESEECELAEEECEPSSDDGVDGEDWGGSAGPSDDGDDDDDDDDPPPDDDDDDDATADAIPCEVQELLAEHCWSCHQDPVQFGAPMPLTDVESWMVPAATEPARPVHDLVMERMADAGRPMPPSGLLDLEQRAVIEDWIAAGFPEEAGAECDPGGPAEDPVGPEYLPCEPDTFVTAHGPAGAGGFEVPLVDDLYSCFVIESDLALDQQGTAWAPVIDDARVVHHMLLLSTDDPDLHEGDVVPDCAALTAGSNMVMGWAPGSENFVMPGDVGLELPDAGEKFILQVHYNNAAGHTDVSDASGFALCTTPTPRENAAGTIWLGTLDIDIPAGQTGVAAGDCPTSRLSEPVTMMMSWPHMHEYGTDIRTDILRMDQSITELVDVPTWNFDNQVYYRHDPGVVVQPGDTIRTTCAYDNTTNGTLVWGEGTGDEMCFNFALVYPVTAFDLTLPLVPPEVGRFCLELPL